MIVRKFTFAFGILIFLLPFVGIPTNWRTVIYVASGVILALSSVDVSFPKRVTKNKSKKNIPTEVISESESVPVYPKDNIIHEPVVIEEVTPVKTVKKRSPRKTKVVH